MPRAAARDPPPHPSSYTWGACWLSALLPLGRSVSSPPLVPPPPPLLVSLVKAEAPSPATALPTPNDLHGPRHLLGAAVAVAQPAARSAAGAGRLCLPVLSPAPPLPPPRPVQPLQGESPPPPPPPLSRPVLFRATAHGLCVVGGPAVRRAAPCTLTHPGPPHLQVGACSRWRRLRQ